MMVITGVGFLIHVYSIGYMHDDDGQNRFFSFLNLFVFFMLLLVMGKNYLIMFVGWEGVGLCSYLLIGFWFKNQEYNSAANKAFIMNRVGDLGMLVGVILIFMNFSSLEYSNVLAGEVALSESTITLITLLLFVGAMGKSAQIPLYTWLPDAMARSHSGIGTDPRSHHGDSRYLYDRPEQPVISRLPAHDGSRDDRRIGHRIPRSYDCHQAK